MDGFGWLSIVPPLIAIILALLTKEVLSSLLVGIFAGALIYTGGNPLASIMTVGKLMASKLEENGSMLLFLSLLGCLVVVVTKAGGSFAYGEWANRKIKSKAGAQLATSILGMLIFIDDYFNCLTVGTVMRPVTDKNKVSRAKLAYIIDSTAAPICIIAPVSSWAASVISAIEQTGLQDGMGHFVRSIPFNLYAILTIVTVLYFSVSKHEIGLMRKYEDEDTSIDLEQQKELEVEVSPKGKVIDLVLPVLALIAFTVFFMFKTGRDSCVEGGITLTAGNIFGEASTNLSLVLGALLSLLVAFIMYIPRKLLKFGQFMESMFDGVKSMVPAMMILTLAWTIGGITRGDYLDTGGFVGHLIEQSSISYQMLPAIVFLAAAVMSFSTGTAWGTFLILIPILVPIIQRLGIESMYGIIFAAIFSGSVFGDHCSPISDTTILSSAGAGCNHITHVKTQLPYALTVAIACFVGFAVGGFSNNPYVTIAVGVAALGAMFVGLRFYTEKRYGK